MSSVSPPPLEDYIGDGLTSTNLSRDNAFLLLNQARLLRKHLLESQCLKFIDKYTDEALCADGFLEIDHATLLSVLERDTLRVREAKLFDAIVRWARAECHRQRLPLTAANQRTVLGRAVSLIRFPLMSVVEFAIGPAQSGLLHDREVVSLFLYFIVNISPKPTEGFLKVPRYCTNNRFRQIESRWGYSGATDRIRFVVDHTIFVVGLGFFGSIDGPADYNLHMKVFHTESGSVCGFSDTTFSSDGSRNTFRVMFNEPIEIRPDTNYTAAAKIKGPDSHYGSEGIRKVVMECPSDRKVTFKFSCAEGENNFTSVRIGQIPEILFYM